MFVVSGLVSMLVSQCICTSGLIYQILCDRLLCIYGNFQRPCHCMQVCIGLTDQHVCYKSLSVNMVSSCCVLVYMWSSGLVDLIHWLMCVCIRLGSESPHPQQQQQQQHKHCCWSGSSRHLMYPELA